MANSANVNDFRYVGEMKFKKPKNRLLNVVWRSESDSVWNKTKLLIYKRQTVRILTRNINIEKNAVQEIHQKEQRYWKIDIVTEQQEGRIEIKIQIKPRYIIQIVLKYSNQWN